MSESDWLLEFKQVTYRYACSESNALQAFDLQIPQGRRCALIGQNGCGKTTMFLLAMGLFQPQQGQVFWQGQPLRYTHGALSQLRQQIGLVFQNPEHQVVATTVTADIAYGLSNLGLTKPEMMQRIEQTISDFDLLELAEEPIHHLSLGQKKRVSIADVMVLQPKLLLLDEPTAYLDPRHTRNLVTLLQEIQARGTTILLASHDLDFVYRWSDWVYVMDQGKLVLVGTPEQVFSQHQYLQDLELRQPVVLELLAEMSLVLGQEQPLSLEQRQQLLQAWRW
jgi:cobalt/nickel transport system ATP-binding protein